MSQKNTKQIAVFSGIIIKDNKILLTQRTEEECPDAHMKWEFPGGKTDFGETPEEAVRREIFEETGAIVEVEQLIPCVQTNYWEYAWGTQQTLCFVFVCKFIEQKEIKKDHHIHDVKWFDLNEINYIKSLPGTKEFIELALKLKK